MEPPPVAGALSLSLLSVLWLQAMRMSEVCHGAIDAPYTIEMLTKLEARRRHRFPDLSCAASPQYLLRRECVSALATVLYPVSYRRDVLLWLDADLLRLL